MGERCCLAEVCALRVLFWFFIETAVYLLTLINFYIISSYLFKICEFYLTYSPYLYFFLLLQILVTDFSDLLTSARRYMFLPAFICLFVCVQHNSKSYGSILMKFSGINCYIKIWKWFIFERSSSKVKVKIDQKVKFT